MKDLLKILPQILGYLPEVLKYASYFKYIPILALVGAIGYGAYYLATIYKDPYKCYHNEIYERMSLDSNVYKFKGGYCVNLDTKEIENTNHNQPSSEEN
jgi:hypothetical protein